MGNDISAPDLTQRPPRSPRVRMGGYVILPRMLDKGRATIVDKNGLYHYACPLDQRFLTYKGIDPEELKEELGSGKGDVEILEWVDARCRHKHEPWEIVQWSAFQEARVPTDIESRSFFSEIHKSAGEKWEDIGTWFELLDLDDYATFGGKV